MPPVHLSPPLGRSKTSEWCFCQMVRDFFYFALPPHFLKVTHFLQNVTSVKTPATVCSVQTHMPEHNNKNHHVLRSKHSYNKCPYGHSSHCLLVYFWIMIPLFIVLCCVTSACRKRARELDVARFKHSLTLLCPLWLKLSCAPSLVRKASV